MDYKTFPCPRCREIIDTTMTSCTYCSAAIDPGEAAATAANQERVQRACGQASSTRITALMMPVFFVLSFAPFIGGIGSLGIAVATVVVLYNGLQWHRRYRGLESADPDLPRARKAIGEAFFAWAVMLVVDGAWFGPRWIAFLRDLSR